MSTQYYKNNELDCNENETEWITAPKEEEWITAPNGFKRWTNMEKLSEMNFEEMPRTSTPIPDLLTVTENVEETTRASYLSWKKHLTEPNKEFRIRGARLSSSEFISGHIIMKDTNNIVNSDLEMPVINRNFINLLLNQPNNEDLISIKSDRFLCHHTKITSPHIYCDCNKYIAQNSDLPIGYIFDENGFKKTVRSYTKY